VASIDELIHHAKVLYTGHGEHLLRDGNISEHLSAYRKRINVSNTLMQQFQIAGTCAACAQEKAGSCCLQEVEEWYDPILLLINLLMGVELPDFHDLPGHCLFVGRKGCKLIARYAFCVNYLCPRLKGLLGPAKTQSLTAVAGEELFAGWEAEKAIRNCLNALPTGGCTESFS